jgi:hypothetical protein
MIRVQNHVVVLAVLKSSEVFYKGSEVLDA